MSVLHPESLWYGAQRDEAQPFIEMSCMDIGGDYCVELQNPETVKPSLMKTVKNQLFPDMISPQRGADGVACVAQMTASADIVGMQDVKSQKPAVGSIHSDPIVSLGGKKGRTGLFGQLLFLGKSDSFLHRFIPDFDHLRKVFFLIGSYDDFHFFSP